MSISAILNTGATGLQVAQTGLRTVSDNVANVNTAGYIRKVVDQTSVATAGVGQGVDVARIRLVADNFLRNASLDAGSRAGEAGAAAEFLDGAQSLFGDPASDTSFFNRLDRMFGAITAAAGEPASAVRRSEVVSAVGVFFDQAAQVSDGLQRLRSEADARIASGVERVNQLLGQIEALNVQISRASALGGAAAGSENEQIGLINELSKLMDIQVQPRGAGGVTLRTSAGMPLTGDGAAKLAYTRAGGAAPETIYGEITITPAGGLPRPFADHLKGGELQGLLTARDRDLPALAEQLGEFASRTADELNRAHNAASAAPAPSQLTGRNTGLDLPTALSGFTGRTAVAVTDAAGRVMRRVDIDFTAGTMSVNGGAGSAFSPATFLASLDAALDPAADASFADGALTLEGRGGVGVVIADDPAAPSAKTGRSFGHFFGMNDLVRSDQPFIYETGLRTTDPHGFGAGETLTLRLSGENGAKLRDVTVAVPAGGTMGDVLAALNSSAGGVGLYGGFSLDGQGRLAFTPTTTPPAAVSVVRDQTVRGAGGPSLSALFGLDGGQRASRADSFSVRKDIAGDGRRLSLARFEYGAAVGAIGLSPGDGRGGAALAEAGERPPPSPADAASPP
jgi:flagellar hook-associated protein 1 FlgK